MWFLFLNLQIKQLLFLPFFQLKVCICWVQVQYLIYLILMSHAICQNLKIILKYFLRLFPNHYLLFSIKSKYNTLHNLNSLLLALFSLNLIKVFYSNFLLFNLFHQYPYFYLWFKIYQIDSLDFNFMILAFQAIFIFPTFILSKEQFFTLLILLFQ